MVIYLDVAATSPTDSRVAEDIQQCIRDLYGNPSAVHELGLQASQRIQKARQHVARLLGISPDQLYFTSGGTESNNMAILGTAGIQPKQKQHWVVSSIEHLSVLQPYERLKQAGQSVSSVPVTQTGRVNPEELAQMVDEHTKLVSLMHVNNETGVIQPVQEATEMIRKKNASTLIHVDGVQAFGKIPVNLEIFKPDFYSISAHKFGGPRGVGGLVIRHPEKFHSMQLGGGQEKGIRSGTENTAGIVGLETAALLAADQIEERNKALWSQRRELIRELTSRLDEIRIMEADDEAYQFPGILSLCIPGTKSEVLVRMLSDDGIYLSAGSACSAQKKGDSHVLSAMGISPDFLEGALRISFDRVMSEEDQVWFLDRLTAHAKQMRRIMKR